MGVIPSVPQIPEDPRIYLQFDHDWGTKEGYLGLSTPILLSNRGGSDAHDVSISKICLRTTEVTFEHPIPVIPKGDTEKTIPSSAALNGMFKGNLIWPLDQEWESYQSLAKETIELPMLVSYKTFDGRKIETRCELVFNGIISALNKPGKEQRNPIEFHNYEFNVRSTGLTRRSA